MSRTTIPLYVSDLSAFTKSLRTSLAAHFETAQQVPSHLVLMNCIARAAGFQNVQSLKASPPALFAPPVVQRESAEQPAPKLTPLALKTLSQFDKEGRLLRLPNKLSVQKLAVWCLWTRFSAKRSYNEREINDVLKAYNTFGDHATLRRELVETKLLERTPDCAVYRKCAAKPSDEIAAMLVAYHAGTHSFMERAKPGLRGLVGLGDTR